MTSGLQSPPMAINRSNNKIRGEEKKKKFPKVIVKGKYVYYIVFIY